MSLQDKYIETNEIDIFQDIEWGQSFEKNSIEQPDIPDYGEPSLDTPSKLSLDPYFLTAPTYSMDLTQYANFQFVYPQLGAADHFLINSLLLELPTGQLANPINSSPPNSPLNRLNISSLNSPLSPSPSVLPSEQNASNPRCGTAGSERSTQECMPKKATNGRLYAYKALDFIPASWDIFAYNSFGELGPGRTYSHKRWCDTCITTHSTVGVRHTTRSSAGLPCGSSRLRKIPLLDTAIPKQVFAGLKIASTLTSSKREIFKWPLMSLLNKFQISTQSTTRDMSIYAAWRGKWIFLCYART